MSMNLGAFSISLAVRDLAASIAFYEKLGFDAAGGGDGWMMMRQGDIVLGLFHGMFEKNMLTFNPGWSQSAQNTEAFTDIRELQCALKAHGLTLDQEVDQNGSGPGSVMLNDPDGNPILIDQHR